jgi:hypothetical protein
VTELVIDANTSGADQYSEAMDKASMSAQQAALAVAGVGVAVVAMLTGLRSFVDYVGNTNKQLIDLNDNAMRANMSTREFQQTLFAARTAGVTEKDFVSGLDRIGADLVAASRGATEFGKMFEANGLSIKDANGKLKDTKSALSDIAGLMQNATPQIQQSIARIVGLTGDWIPFLRDGADAIERQKAVAESLGILLDDDVIQKAKDFDREWRLAIATWDTQFKASLVAILPLMVKLAGYAVTIIEAVGKVGGFFAHALTPVDQMGTADLDQQVNDVAALSDKMAGLNGQVGEFLKFKLQTNKAALGLPEDADLAAVDAYQDKLQDMYDAKKAAVDAPTRVLVNGGTQLPPTGGGDSNDAVDKAINSLRRHTEQQIADTKAIGQGAAALAGFRADAALTSAVQANGGEITASQATKFAELKARAMEAGEALAKAKVADEIKTGHDTALLSSEDVQIAQQLKQIYPDVATALGSAEASALRFNKAIKDGATAFTDAAGPALLDFEMGVKKGSDAFKDFELQFIRSLLNMINQMVIFAPIARGFQSLLTGGLNLSGFGFNPIAGITGSAHGNIFAGGNVIPFARGGVVDSPTLAPMALFGEAGPEAIVPLRRGPDGNLGIASQGGGGSTSIVFGDIKVSVPEGTSPDNAAAIASAVKTTVVQAVDERVAYHMRSRGMLNRVA